MRTYGDIQKLCSALEWLGNQRPGPSAKPSMYNALNLRLQLAVEAYRPILTALVKSQREIFAKYEKLAGDDLKPLENNRVTFGLKLDREYSAELEELLDTPVEDEPKRRAFKLSDFDVVGISIPQFIMDQMGSLLERPAVVDPDALDGALDPATVE